MDGPGIGGPAPPTLRRWSHRSADPISHLELSCGHIAVGYRGRPPEADRCEDAALILELGAAGCLLAVADGMGSGVRAADAAAAIVDALASRAQTLAEEDSPSRIEVLDAIEEADRRIRDWGVGAATTVAVAVIDAGSYRTYHVGDSEAMVIGQRGKLKWQTVSQSSVGYAQASGLLDPREAMVHEERHLVDSMVGMPGMRLEVGERRNFAPRDTMVLATDGLLDNLQREEIVEIVRKGPLDRAAQLLLARSVERMEDAGDEEPGKPDDLAFILYRPHTTTRKPR